MPIIKQPVTRPVIYDEFQCKGGACRNTCCQKWRIDISRAEYNKIRHRIKSAEMEKIFKRVPRKQATDLKYATMQMDEQSMCPFLSDDRLCSLQKEHGYYTLPQICKQFPRLLTQIAPSKYSLALDTGCERILELLWAHSENGLQFITRDELINAMYLSDFSNTFLPDFVEDIRNLCVWLLQNRAYSLSDRMIILGLAMRELQEIQDTDASECVPNWFIKWQRYCKGNDLKSTLAELQGDRKRFVLNNIKTLLPLCPSISCSNVWLAAFEKHFSFSLESNIVSFSMEQYDEMVNAFDKHFPNIDRFLENYMVLTIFRQTFPFGQDSVWKSYLYLTSFYSMLRFLMISLCPQTAEQLIDYLTEYSRISLNARFFVELTTQSLEKYDSTSLAHLAILVRG